MPSKEQRALNDSGIVKSGRLPNSLRVIYGRSEDVLVYRLFETRGGTEDAGV